MCRQVVIPLFVLSLVVSPAVGQEIEPFDEVLAQVGLDREHLRFDTYDMSNYGGDEFR